MELDDRFEALIDTLGGFYRTWLVFLGLELGLLHALREAGVGGLTVEELASRTGTQPDAVDVWAWAADAHALVDFVDGRLVLDAGVGAVLLDEARPEYLGGQFVHAVASAMDWDRMASFFRSGQPVRERPDRYRVAIEQLTVQDIAVFFQEVLSALPQLTSELRAGGRVLDVHCGGGRWLIAMARRFPSLQLVGVEFEPDSVARARTNVAAAGLAERISVEEADPAGPRNDGPYDLVYYQYALHQLPDAVASLRARWSALRPGGRILVLDWPLPSTVEEFRTRHGELIAGVQLDEVFQGSRLVTREQFVAWFREAGLPEPQRIDLPSGAVAFVAVREG